MKTRNAVRRDRGSVTAEFAVALPAAVVVLALGLGAVGAAAAELRCVDAARAGARAMARGESPPDAVAAARAAAPSGAVISIRTVGERVSVEVTGRFSLLGSPGGHHLSVPVRAVEQATLERATGS